MNKKRSDSLHKTVTDFLAFLHDEEVNYDNHLIKLNVFLDEISLTYHSIPSVSVEKFIDTQKLEYEDIRRLVIKHFPELGLYNLPQEITQHIGQTNLVIGDAVDDVTDILCDLSEISWCFENADENDALWHFRSGYEHHWGKHLKQLQLYLHSLQHENEASK